jgi:hypothetical protein
VENSGQLQQELLDKWENNLKSDSLFDIAEAAAYLGESGNPLAIRPLVDVAEATQDWLVQDLVVRALGVLAERLPEAKSDLEKIKLIEPPVSGHILELKQTERTPYILFDFEKGSFFLKGKETGDWESITAMFESINFEFSQFNTTFPDKPFIVSFCLKTNSTIFSKELYKFLCRIRLHPNTIVYWYYEIFGDSITYIGEDFESIVNMKFIYLEIPQNGPCIGNLSDYGRN